MGNVIDGDGLMTKKRGEACRNRWKVHGKIREVTIYHPRSQTKMKA
jgi:hypothetical protein